MLPDLTDGMLEGVAEHAELLHNDHHVEHRVPVGVLHTNQLVNNKEMAGPYSSIVQVWRFQDDVIRIPVFILMRIRILVYKLMRIRIPVFILMLSAPTSA